MFPDVLRQKVLDLVEAGNPVKDAAEIVGVTAVRIYGWARRDEVFSAAVNHAAWTLCTDRGGSACSTARQHSAGCRGTGLPDRRPTPVPESVSRPARPPLRT
ncbi:hypothetical protein C8250_041910 [Streptomyces sp. So13.3]|nr:hypothetical protein C8250_041910 [Streptomyces sp. So13.3]